MFVLFVNYVNLSVFDLLRCENVCYSFFSLTRHCLRSCFKRVMRFFYVKRYVTCDHVVCIFFVIYVHSSA